MDGLPSEELIIYGPSHAVFEVEICRRLGRHVVTTANCLLPTLLVRSILLDSGNQERGDISFQIVTESRNFFGLYKTHLYILQDSSLAVDVESVLGVFTKWILAVLPMFRRYVLRPCEKVGVG
jgi:hypothetical protein